MLSAAMAIPASPARAHRANIGFWQAGSPDVTPDPVNWTNIVNSGVADATGNAQTITGINVPITLELIQDVYYYSWSGSYFSVNGGSWIFFDTTSVNVTVSPGDSIQFKASGCSGRLITVKNASDGGALLDSYEYSSSHSSCPP